MADPLKEMFNKAYFNALANAIQQVWKPFPANDFMREVCLGLDVLSLNERMRHCVVILQRLLPQDFKEAVGILRDVIPLMPGGYQNLLFPDFVGVFGLADATFSLDALKFFTQFGSSEFAVRHFFKAAPKATLAVMETWACDENVHVRRLASEGSRPRLPWSFKLDAVLENPQLTHRILEALKADPALYVRKSVANHLNDLSKDHTDIMLSMVEGWDLSVAETAWIVKHACRTLIKKGNTRALSLFAFEQEVGVRLDAFELKSTSIALGERLQFAFVLHSTKDSPQKLVVDYRIHYVKQGGQLSAKVFKLKEVSLASGASMELAKNQVIQDFTTRKHYAGTHKIEILVNGVVMHEADFELHSVR